MNNIAIAPGPFGERVKITEADAAHIDDCIKDGDQEGKFTTESGEVAYWATLD